MVIKVGDIVDYHFEIGGKIDSRCHRVISLHIMGGEVVAKISNKAGVVSMDALTPIDTERLVKERRESIKLLKEVIEYVDYREDLWEKIENLVKEMEA